MLESKKKYLDMKKEKRNNDIKSEFYLTTRNYTQFRQAETSHLNYNSSKHY